MEGFIGLTRRNVKIYFKDTYSVIFSMLTSMIVFALYMLFLRGTFVDAIEDTMMGVDYDILATPVKRWQIILSYLVAAVISSFAMTAMLLTIGLAILSFMGNLHITALSVLAAYGVVFLGCLSSSALFMTVVLFFKSSSAATAFFGILSAAAGFVIGAYIPISQFSSGIQTFCNIFPASQVCALLRHVLLEGITDAMNDSIGGIDNGLFIDEIQKAMTFNASIFGHTLPVNAMCIYIVVFTALCLGAMVFLYTKVYKK